MADIDSGGIVGLPEGGKIRMVEVEPGIYARLVATTAMPGGSGGASTVANGADVAEGATTDAPYVGAETGTARTVISLLKGVKNAIYTTIVGLLGGGLPASLAAGGGLKVEGVAGGVAQPVSIASLPTLASGANNIGDVDEAAIACAAADVHAPAVNTAAVVTYGASATLKHIVTGIAWSYVGGIPVGGNIKVEDVSGTTVFTMDIAEEGPGFIVFPKPKKGAAVNTAMIVTLAAGGAAITGKLSVLNHYLEA